MKQKTLIAWIMFTLISISSNLSAQILIRSEADSIVMNLLSEELTNINIYVQKSALLNTSVLPLYRDLDTLSVPFNNCYIYFIDNCPEKFWSHSGRYAFVDIASSSVVIRDKTRFPKDFSLLAYETKYELISYSYDPSSYRYPPQIDVTNVSPITSHIETYDNLYAIIIAPRFNDETSSGSNENIITNGEKPFQWRNVSLLYSTLINNMGVKKENCILMYDNDGISDMIMDIDGDGLLENVGSDFDGDGINDIDFPCKTSDVEMVFKELSGTNNIVPSISPLTTEDILMVYTIGVGFGSNPLILPGSTDYPYLYCHEGGNGWTDEDWYLDSFEFAEYLSEVNCGYMSIAMFNDHSGDFMAELSNNQHNFLCDNKVIVTSCGVDEANVNGTAGGWEYDYPGGFNVYGLYSEYLMYFVSAIRGYYPVFYDSDNNYSIDSSTPWIDGAAVGQREFTQIHWHTDVNNIAVDCMDFNPDINNDSITTVLEAHRYAKTHHNQVNFTYPEIGGENYCFLPVHYNSSGIPDEVNPDLFSSYPVIEHLFGITGYCGTITNNTTLPTMSILGSRGLTINSATTSIVPNSIICLSERSKIKVEPDANLSIGSNSTIKGNNHTVVHDETSPVWISYGNSIDVYGNISVASNVNFSADSNTYWDGIDIDNSNNICINGASFTRCNLKKKNGTLSINNSSFIESHISSYDAYFIISDCSINGSIYCLNSPFVFITCCHIIGNGDGIILSDCTDYGIYNSNISGGNANGISVFETNGTSSYHISDCIVSDNSGEGVRFYNSIGKIISCTISGNNKGVTAYRVSNVTIEKDPD